MKTDKFLQFDDLIDTLDEDSATFEDLQALSGEERQMFLTAKALKGMASYDVEKAGAFKKLLSERLMTLPAASKDPAPVPGASWSFSEIFQNLSRVLTAQKKAFAVSFAALLVVFAVIVGNISRAPVLDLETSRLIADLSGGLDAPIQNERELHAAFSPVEMDDLEMVLIDGTAEGDPSLVELLELSSSLDDFDPNEEEGFEREILDFNTFSTL